MKKLRQITQSIGEKRLSEKKKKIVKESTIARHSISANFAATEKSAGTRNHQTLLKRCLVHLSSVGIFCYPNNTGAIKGKYDTRYQRYGFPGSPDILGIMPDGRYLGIEIKTGCAVQNKNQKKFEKKIKENNGIYWIIKSLENLDGELALYRFRNNWVK